jgi:hypothetical protein
MKKQLPGTSSRQDNQIAPLFSITVDDPQKVGDPIRGFTMYTVHTRVSLSRPSAFLIYEGSFPFTDNVSSVHEVIILCSPPLFRLPMALRDPITEQSGRPSTTHPGEKHFPSV